jgi:FkbM family methyltransferase
MTRLKQVLLKNNIVKTIIFSFIRRFFPTKRDKYKNYSFKGRFKLRTRDGLDFYLYNNHYNLESNLFWQGYQECPWEKQERLVWAELAKESKIIFDIGANTGIYSIVAKAKNTAASVFAFEPQPNVHLALSKNNAINKFDIKCESIALSSKSGRASFYNYGNNTFTERNTTAGSLNPNWRRKDQETIEVQTETLANYCKEKGVNKIDLMKIDVETHEYEVLKGYTNLIHSHKPYIILEIQSLEIGRQIERLFDSEIFHFYKFTLENGLEAADHLGGDDRALNYLISPKAIAKLQY